MAHGNKNLTSIRQHHSELGASFPDATKVKRSLGVKVIEKTDRQRHALPCKSESAVFDLHPSLAQMPGILNKIRIQVAGFVFMTHRHERRTLNRDRVMCLNFYSLSIH